MNPFYVSAFCGRGDICCFSAIVYPNYVLKQPTAMNLIVMLLMVTFWFCFISSPNKSDIKAMNELEGKFLEILES
jgi:hypothetical protein